MLFSARELQLNRGPLNSGANPSQNAEDAEGVESGSLDRLSQLGNARQHFSALVSNRVQSLFAQ